MEKMINFVKDNNWTEHEYNGMVFYRSPESNKVGPVCYIEYIPTMGCDAWALRGTDYENIQMPEQDENSLPYLLKGLGIPCKQKTQAEIDLLDTVQACLEAVGVNFDDLDAAEAEVRSRGTKPSHYIRSVYQEANNKLTEAKEGLEQIKNKYQELNSKLENEIQMYENEVQDLKREISELGDL